MLRPSRMQAVKDPIIPLVGDWTRATPGTISLGQGIVSYPPPPDVFDAIAQLDPMVHRYQSVQGLPSLRERIQVKLRQDNQIVLDDIGQIVVTAGSNMGFMNAILAVTEPGDEVILQTPYYFNHEMALRMANVMPVLVPTTESFQLDVDAIATAITDKTKAIVTISPNNPTGAVYAVEDLKAVNQLCGDRGLFHISDEAYDYFVYDESHHCSPAQFDSDNRHTISLFSLSKAYGFAGWRIGYMVIPKILQLDIQKIQDTILICPVLTSQVAAEAALTVGRRYPADKIQALAKTRQLILDRLQPTHPVCSYRVPQGAFYVWLNVSTSLSSIDLVRSLIQDFKVAVIPGSAFGPSSGCYLRIAYGALDAHTVDEGLSRLVAGLERLVGY